MMGGTSERRKDGETAETMEQEEEMAWDGNVGRRETTAR